MGLPCLRTPHTHFERGTPLRIILRDGRTLYDHYEDHGSGHMRLRKAGKLQLRLVKSVTVWKGKVNVEPPPSDPVRAPRKRSPYAQEETTSNETLQIDAADEVGGKLMKAKESALNRAPKRSR